MDNKITNNINVDEILINIYENNFKVVFEKDTHQFYSNSWFDMIFLTNPDFTNLNENLKEITFTEKFKIRPQQYKFERLCLFFKNNNSELNFYTLLKNNKILLANLLKERIDKNQSHHTLYNDLSFLCKLYSLINKQINNDISNFISDKYKRLLKDFKFVVINNSDGLNILNKYEKIKFIEFEDIINICENLKDDTYEQHLLKLLLSLYIYTPPLRSEPLNFKFIFDKKNNNGTDDFIYFNEDIDDKVYFILNTIIKGHKPIIYFLNDEKLINFIKNSYKRFPREVVISSRYNKDLNIKTQNKIQYFKKIDKRLSINNIRSSYYSYYYKKFNYIELKEAVKKSRTSIQNIAEYYYKNFNEEIID